ncbi:MAG: PEGA domain-containing protein [Ignavibacteriales bacterium]|nr:MAG: PEGA domain-containing protein [Ignavibacteriales bacterium]
MRVIRDKILMVIFFIVSFFFAFLSCAKEVSVTPDDPAVSTGFFKIESNPSGAKIYINGTNTGKFTPDSIRFLEDGDYKILLRLTNWKDTSIYVTINNGEKKELFVNFKTNPTMYGSIKLTSYPSGASILLDDSVTGKFTPTNLSNLLPGTHTLTLKKAGCENDIFDVKVESQQITEIHRVLPDTTYWIIYRTTNSGIPTNSVLSLAIDNENTKWIGTDGKGIAVLKGNEWTIYNKSNSPLPDNRIQCILIDKDNNKWFGTTYYGLVKFDGTNWTIYNTTNSGLPANNIYSLVQAPDGKIWIGTYNTGIAVYDGNSFTIYNKSNSGLPSNFITSIAIPSLNDVWVSTFFGGIAHFKNNTWKVYDESNAKISNDVNVIAVDNKGSVYAGTADAGPLKFDGTNWSFIQPPFAFQITSIIADEKNYVWFGSSDNGFSLIQAMFTFRDIYNEVNSPLVVSSVNAIAVDNDNYKWIGTWGGGLVKFKGKQQ